MKTQSAASAPANAGQNASKTNEPKTKTQAKRDVILYIALEGQDLTYSGRLMDMAGALAKRADAIASKKNAETMADALKAVPDGPAKDAGLKAILDIVATADATIKATEDARSQTATAVTMMVNIISYLDEISDKAMADVETDVKAGKETVNGPSEDSEEDGIN